MKSIKLLTLLLLASCSTTFDFDEWDITYPKELEPQIQLWKEYAPEGIKYKRLTIQLTGEIFLSDGTQASGVAIRKERLIKLDTTSHLYKEARTMLVIHELGHYVLHRPHKDGLFTWADGVWDVTLLNWPRVNFPISLMTSKSNIPDDVHLRNPVILDYYMTELFNN